MYKVMYNKGMGRMIRKQIYIKPEQDEMLKERARRVGMSEAELIREYIEKGMQQPTEAERKKAWEKERAFIEKRMKMRVPQTGRQWTRDELYEERLERFSR